MEDHLTEPTDYTSTCGNNDNLQSNKRMKVTTTTSTTASLSNKKKKSSKLQSLGGIFHYLEGMILMVELKNGTMYVGSLLSSGTTSEMNMMLSNVLHINNNNKTDNKDNNNNTDNNTTSIQTNKHINHSKLLQYYNQVLAVSQQKQQQQQQHQVDPPIQTTTSNISVKNQPPKRDRSSSSSSSNRTRTVNVNTITLLQTVYIRGSTIRYIHFIDTSFGTINHMIQQGIRREKYGQQLYQRNTLRMKEKR